MYQSLLLPPSARTAALGGYQIAVVDNELTLGLQNPALINAKMHRQMTFNQSNYLADINFGFAGYGHSINEATTLLGGVQYINYGDFIKADEYGNIEGSFSGDDLAVSLGLGHTWKYGLSVGASLKFIYAHMANYFSSGLAMDLGATHHYPKALLTTSLVVRNLGFQLKTFSGNHEPLPLDIQLGVSKRLANAPFRLNLTLHHLHRPDMRYVNTNAPVRINLETGEPEEEKISLADNLFRHAIIGTEILLSENFHLRLGYNHQRRRELALANIKGLVGYNMGFGMKIWRFHVDYAYSSYHLAGGSHYFSATSNLQSWMKKEA